MSLCFASLFCMVEAQQMRPQPFLHLTLQMRPTLSRLHFADVELLSSEETPFP
jgi:hypothetical protein